MRYSKLEFCNTSLHIQHAGSMRVNVFFSSFHYAELGPPAASLPYRLRQDTSSPHKCQPL